MISESSVRREEKPESTGVCNQDIVCILGMHRSGTSLVTRMLNLIGVYLGPEHLLLEANFANPTGYWELDGFVSINDEILARFGGSWDEPPLLSPGWETDPVIDDLKERARRLIQDTFAKAKIWGWKDPRSCITLPFWQQLLPDMRYIISLRSPLDVSRSLEQRDKFSAEKSSDLWLTYVNYALEQSDGKPRLITFYEDLMDDCLSELRRLADFLGKPERAEQVAVQETVRVPQQVCKRVPVTYTYRVPRTVVMKIPIESACCGASAPVVAPAEPTPAAPAEAMPAAPVDPGPAAESAAADQSA